MARQQSEKCGHEPVLFTRKPVEYEEAQEPAENQGNINILEMAAQKALPIYAAYYCHADDTVASEPTMDIIKKFHPELLLRMKNHLPGFAPFMSNQKLKDHTGWMHNHTWRIYV